MRIRDFQKANIREVTNCDLRVVFNTTFNSNIRTEILEEFQRREVGA